MALVIKSKIIKTASVNWRKLLFLQEDSFKALEKTAKEKLKSSVLSHQFSQPFYVWQDESTGEIFCLDGKHRSIVLEELVNEGVEVPDELPATFIQCADKKEAAELVLQYSSIYAKITQQGLFDFMEAFELDFEKLNDVISLPEFSVQRFEQKFDLFEVGGAEEPETVIAEADVIVRPGDIFQLNGHRMVCASFKDAAAVEVLMQGEKGRIVNCDPPYNLPANFFTNKDEKRHENFAEAAGEMDDEQFALFLATIMQASVDHTVPGAIHYIFMDFRHAWHMTEASRRVYGRVEPKQVCVWVKDLMANGSFYRAQQELCFIFSNDQAKHLWNNDIVDHGGFYKNENELCYIFKNGNDNVPHLSNLAMENRIRTNVWRYPSAVSTANPDRFQLKNHPTPKPVAMIADAILDTTKAGDIVIDWFLGSGTCLIACEHTGRKGRFTEIMPKYVQSDIVRFVNYCGKRNIPVEFKHENGHLTLDQIIATN